MKQKTARVVQWLPLAIPFVLAAVLIHNPGIWPMLPYWLRAVIFLGAVGGVTIGFLAAIIWFLRQ
ncbi:DUF4175 domain-containing protein [Stakelama tenebrarum]|uniref:DUF4175 domain-containing protein n=1 Tax=Stakelama tenebrarum TaxID=2711215 RepID=A0A6G6Y7N6_9SPHN|nr:DUF4175 domain-containing protein [Sphingosinithalassobacter tenebrarum]QIG80586.1 DUF4175 domain-containing protein [Sphingosinithalassobacter tenebrarum]